MALSASPSASYSSGAVRLIPNPLRSGPRLRISAHFSSVCTSPSLRIASLRYAQLPSHRSWPALGGIRSRKAAGVKDNGFKRVLCSLEGTSGDLEPSSSSGSSSGPGPYVKWILVAAVVVAAGVAIYMKMDSGALTSVVSDPGQVVQASSEAAASFNIKLPGFSLSLGERTPGWIYFVLLMAAGFGLFVSEEALNVWVGASLARGLTYGSRDAFLSSLSANAPHIISTLLWVYWGVCISDLVPFYAGKLAANTGDQVREKLGVSKEKYDKVRATVQRYGNLIGFVERFSVGIRNPTAFLAGVAGISPINFFVGVCFGGLITFPIQLSIGFALRENPVAALAGVAAVVGAWTVFPYAAAGIASLYYFLTRSTKKSA
ncbi:hypothetical protein Mapa_000968 [Marchantia paleacea]|nr:hypothetical protein Mapa_000968 [Marchantia paleacea]